MSELKNSLVNLAAHSGALGLAARWRRGNPLILMYHGVSANIVSGNSLRNCEEKHIPVDVFAHHLKAIARSRRAIPLHEMIEGLHSGDDMRGTIALTFDDGYENNVHCAAPILSDLKIPAAFFLTTGFVGTERCMWTDQLEIILDRTAASSVLHPLTGQTFPLGSMDEKRSVLRQIKDSFKNLPLSQTLAAVTQLADQLKVSERNPYGDYRFMSWEHARALVNAGFEVGAHTVNHLILSRIPLDDAKTEILASRDCVQEKIGLCSTTFCYPNGKSTDYTQELADFCRQHFRAALSTNRGPAMVEELYELRRLGVPVGPKPLDIDWLLLREH